MKIKLTVLHKEIHNKGWLHRQNSYYSLVSTDDNCTPDMTGAPPNKLLLQPIWAEPTTFNEAADQFRAHSSPCPETTWVKAINNSFTDNNWLQGPSDLILACLQGLVVNKPISPIWEILSLGIQLTVQTQTQWGNTHRGGHMQHFFICDQDKHASTAFCFW